MNSLPNAYSLRADSSGQEAGAQEWIHASLCDHPAQNCRSTKFYTLTLFPFNYHYLGTTNPRWTSTNFICTQC